MAKENEEVIADEGGDLEQYQIVERKQWEQRYIRTSLILLLLTSSCACMCMFICMYVCIGICMCAFVHQFMRACVPPEQLFFL